MLLKNIKELINKKLFKYGGKGRKDARRAGAILLCASLAMGNMPASAITAFAADDDTDEAGYIYEIDSISFATAIQEAVYEGNYLEQELKFLGDAAEEYDELFNPDGTLYELNMDTLEIEKDKDRDKDLNLRVFARVTEEIPLDEAYVIGGEENIIFLLQNKTDEGVSAEIYVDEKESEAITVPTAADIDVRRYPVEAEGTIVTNEDDVVVVIQANEADERSFSGGSGNGLGTGRGSNASLRDSENDEHNEDTEKDDTTDESGSRDPNVNKDRKSEQTGKNSGDRSDKKTDKGNAASDENSDRSENDTDRGNSDKDSSDDKKSGNKGSEQSRQNIERSNDNKDDKDRKDNKSERSSASNKENSSSESGSSDDKNDSEIKTASISTRSGNVLTASAETETASVSDAEKASPSDASAGFNGTFYEPVRLGNHGAVAYVTTAEDLGLNKVVLEDYGIMTLADTDKCGEDLTWSFDNGKLIISGSGDMYDWNSGSATPWANFMSDITSVALGDDVTSIGGHAFEGAGNLISVDFGSSLKSIGTWAFCYDYAVMSVEFPDTLETIESYAFYGCDLTGIEETITVDTGAAIVTRYGTNDTNSTTDDITYTGSVVEIPDSVTSVGNGAFGTTHAKYFVIGSGLTSFNGAAFASHYLEAVIVDNSKLNVSLTNESGLWGSLWVDNDVAIVYRDGLGGGDVSGSGQCGDDLTWVLDKNVLTISGTGDMYVWGTVNNVPWYSYRDYIASVVIETSATDIGKLAFESCRNLESVEIADTVTTIGDSAFYDCPSLKKVLIPSGITSIGQSAFYGCTNLNSITFENDSELVDIGTSIFQNCTSLVEIKIPSGITELGSDTFKNCTSLTKAEALGSITYLGSYVFDGCNALTELFNLADVASMEDIGYQFRNCSSLTGDIDLSSLDTIPQHAFEGDNNIESVKFSDDLASIGTWAFCYCYALEAIDLPETLQTIESYAFWGCDLSGDKSIQTITVDPGAAVETRFGTKDTTSTNDTITYTGSTVIIPDSVTSIGTGAFGTTHAQYFVIGTGLTNFDGGVFASHNLGAVVIDNFKGNITISSKNSIWGYVNQNDDVVIVYRDGAFADDEDDVVSKDPDNPFYTMTLQDAVNAVASGEMDGPITIDKDIVLSATLIVPEENAVVINASDTYRMTGSNGIDTLITVKEGADLTLGGKDRNGNSDGSLIIYGNWKNNITSIVTVNGSFTLKDGATLTKATINSSNCGAVLVSGSNASFTMAGGYIEDNTVTAVNAATVFVTDGAEFNMTGGCIQKNTSTATQEIGGSTSYGVCVASSGVMLYGSAEGSMSGGTIQNNYSYNGSAIYLYSNSEGDYPVKFEISGGTINGNTSPSTKNASGAVMVEANSSLVMTGGEISDNYGYAGGGIAITDAFSSAYPEGRYKTEFIMNGGVITGNSAYNGGGIYSYSDGVELHAGEIINNTASNMGGGIYVEGESDYYTWAHMTNVYIADNTASRQGGGMWFCPTGVAEIYVNNGGAIADNTSYRAGDDLVFAANYAGQEDTMLQLADRILGGGKVDWYQDGGVYTQGEGNLYPGTNSEAPRYGSDGYDDYYEDNGLVNAKDPTAASWALKAIATTDAKAFAEVESELFITGNSALYGGGVGANGGVTIGENTDLTEVAGSKTWDDENDKDGIRPDEIIINLIAETVDGDTYILETKVVTPDENGDWDWNFENLPNTDSSGNRLSYSFEVREESVEGYEPTYGGGNGYDITNTHTPGSDNPPSSRGGHGGSGSGGGSGMGGPGDSGGSGDGDIWDLLPLPATGQGWAMLISASVLLISAIAMIILSWYKRRESKS